MTLSAVRTVFGIHSICPYNRTTRLPYGIAKVVGSSSFTLSGETVDLFGGSSKYAWQVEDGTISAELAMTLREYPDFGFEVFLGKALTENTDETSGNVSTLTDANGTTLADATTGIDSVTLLAGSASELKFGKYVIKAYDTTSVDVYCSTDLDFARGTDEVYENDLLKITASPLTVPDSGSSVAIDNFGLNIISGSGTIAFDTNDTGYFNVRPVNTSNVSATFGGVSDVYPEFGCLVYGQQQGSERMFELDIFRLKAIGMPVNFSANEFSEAEITAKAFYDSARSGVFSMREIVI